MPSLTRARALQWTSVTPVVALVVLALAWGRHLGTPLVIVVAVILALPAAASPGDNKARIDRELAAASEDLVAATARAQRAAADYVAAVLLHFGVRDRNHMLLLPPVLTRGFADATADGIVRLREATGREVLPENPPGQVFVGDLGLLDYFARVCERADTGSQPPVL